MKYIIVLVVVVFAVWLWRTGRDRALRDRADQKAKPPAVNPKLEEPQDMVRCPVCSVHLPRIDALPGPGGQVYCCAEHSRQAGG